MTQFCRTRSKVWWPTYFSDDQDDTENAPIVVVADLSESTRSATNNSANNSWRRAINSDRSSSRGSSSPSSGSQRSQDSGFSDSESSPSTTTAKVNKAVEQQLQEEQPKIAPNDVIDGGKNCFSTLLPDTPVKMSKSSLIRHKNRRKKENEAKDKNMELVKSKCGSISNYLAECYFPVYDLHEFNALTDKKSSNDPTATDRFNDSNELLDKSSSSASTKSDTNNRTCFIVDELPKMKKTSVAVHSQGKTKCANGNCGSKIKALVDYYNNAVSKDVCDRNNNDRNCKGADCTGTKGPSNDRTVSIGETVVDSTVVRVKSANDSPILEGPKKSTGEQRNSVNSDEISDSSNSCHQLNVNLDETKFSIDFNIEPTQASTPIKHRPEKFTGVALSSLPASLPLPSSHPLAASSLSANLLHQRTPPVLASSQNLPVNYWLQELKYSYQSECTITLQSKPIMRPVTMEDNQSKPISVDITTDYVISMYEKAKLIREEFSQIYRKINQLAFDQVSPLLQILANKINDFLATYAILLVKSDVNMNRDFILLTDLCDQLKLTAGFPKYGQLLWDEVNALGQSFSHFVNNLLIVQVKILLSSLQETESESKLINSLLTISSLSIKVHHIGELVSYCNGVKYLLPLCTACKSTTRTAAMRTLATICCYSGSVKQFEKDDGVQILSNILSDLTRPESELLEAVSVLVQITAPWVEDSHCVKSLAKHLNSLTNSLTCLISTTDEDETLLLTAAALANISFLEPLTVWCLLEAGTIGCLLTAVRRQGSRASVFLQEQTATLIANMASVAESRAHLAEHRAVVALICFLQVRHSPLQSPAEIKAAERLQHKSAIALSRLCSDKEICQQVVDLNGARWLVQLCKEERERNYRDDVLLACLASLRKIANNCGKSVIDELNANELVEPRFVDSYLLYSSKQESYV